MKYGVIPEGIAEHLALWAGKVPVPVFDTLVGAIKARTLMAGVKLGVFEALAGAPCSAAEVATGCRLDPDATQLLLRTLAYAGYLDLAADGRFGLTALGRSMVPGSAAPMWGFVRWNYEMWKMLEHMETLIQTGQGLDFHRTMTDPAAWADYQRAMVEIARKDAPVVAAKVPVERGATRLLDLAGLHGLIGAAICRRHPPLKSTVLDLPAAIEPARALARETGIADVVEHRAGNLVEDDLGTGWNVVLMANILHHFEPEAIRTLLARVRAATTAGGTVAIWELESPSADAKPDLGDGTALFFRLTSTARCHNGDDYAGWLQAAGFTRVEIVRPMLSPGNVLVTGR